MKRKLLDQIAIFLSLICTIHCIVVPILLGIFPIISGFVFDNPIAHDFWFHRIILVFVLPFSVLAHAFGYLTHRNILITLLGAIGLGLLVFTAIFAHQLIEVGQMNALGERLLTLAGGLIHAASHVLNVIHCNRIHCSVTSYKTTKKSVLQSSA